MDAGFGERVPFGSRDEALLQCFQVLDKDRSGFIELGEFRAFVTQFSPQANLDEAKLILRFLDRDGDYRVSPEEFHDAMQVVISDMQDEEFEGIMRAVLGGLSQDLFGSSRPYHHPEACRDYLNAELMPLLRDGLLQLVHQLEHNRLHLAAGTEWEDGQYLPHNWQPFSPMRWLARWLEQHNPLRPPTPSTPPYASPFGDRTREQKAELAFRHLDRDNSGALDVSELMALAGRLRAVEDAEAAAELLRDLDVDLSGTVDLAEYTNSVLALGMDLDEPSFDEAIRQVLAADHLTYCATRPEKLAFLFRGLDTDGSGALSLDELRALAMRMDPDMPEERVDVTLELMDKDRSHTVSCEEFVVALDRFLGHITSMSELDRLIVGMLQPSSRAAASPLEEVEPEGLRDYVASLPGHRAAVQLGVLHLMDRLNDAPLVLLDARTAEEQSISMIPGALRCTATLADSSTAQQPQHSGGGVQRSTMPQHGVVLDERGVAGARAAVQALTARGVRPLVVVYCNTGSRGNPASLALSDELGLCVRNLCGGIVSYYNQGGSVKDAEGSVVQSVHPGVQEVQMWIERPSRFRM